MTFRATFPIAASLLLTGALAAQTPLVPAPAFAIADIHPSPTRAFPYVNGGFVTGNRYTLHQATLVDLIIKAYKVDPSLIQGGPASLEWNRFDIVAEAPANTSPETLRLMLQSLLADRFKLVLHHGDLPMPAYALTVAKSGSKLKEADPTTPSDCKYQPPPAHLPPGTVSNISFVCHNRTLETIASTLQNLGSDYLSQPVFDATGIQGAWDFSLQWTDPNSLAKAGSDGISFSDAVEKQLGLKLTLQNSPRPVLIVDNVSETPTPNSPEVAKRLPTPPPAQFEVAIIKPSRPDEVENGDVNRNEVNLKATSLMDLISFAWDFNSNDKELVAGAPAWMNSDHFDILAKVSTEGLAHPSPEFDEDDLRQMVRDLITERFQIKYHMEDRPISAYTLLAVKPRLRKADPQSRTRCKEGPGLDGKDPRTTNPQLIRLLNCQNMTMAQISKELQHVAAGYIYGPVLDATGLQGSFDFTLSFSTSNLTAAHTGGVPAAEGTASDPNGALTLYDAVSRQLGLKLEKQKRLAPVLVIDHIEEKPIQN